MTSPNTKYKLLEEILADLILEEQAKLGYRKESIRFYFPLSSLRHIFKNASDADEMQSLLADFPAFMQEHYGAVNVSHRNERFCFQLSEQASEYVHLHKDPDDFILQLVALMSNHGTTMTQIIELFHKQPCDCIIEDITDGEFDTAIHFIDSTDRYYYCFKDEGCHIIYHRFLPEDYAELL